MSLNIHNIEFIRSAVKKVDFPTDGLPQVVFAGKSNVGKSSTINKVMLRKKLAKVANTPGKTVHINLFLLDQKGYLVDLPGYGYAKVSKSERARWAALIEQYFQINEDMSLGVLIVDYRHKPTNDDIIMADWFINSGKPFVVVANKHDKVRPMQRVGQLELIREKLKLPESVDIIEFSAEKGTNRDELFAKIESSILGE